MQARRREGMAVEMCEEGGVSTRVRRTLFRKKKKNKEEGEVEEKMKKKNIMHICAGCRLSPR